MFLHEVASCVSLDRGHGCPLLLPPDARANLHEPVEPPVRLKSAGCVHHESPFRFNLPPRNIAAPPFLNDERGFAFPNFKHFVAQKELDLVEAESDA